MKELKVKVLKNLEVGPKTYLMELEFPYPEEVKPGHFLMLKSWKGLDPLGRRAFAIADKEKDRVSIYYQVVGRGTALMAGLKEGEIVEVLGPLGNRLFNLEGQKHLLLGGGIGMPGLSLLAKALKALGKEVFVCYGARTSNLLVMKKWLRENGIAHRLFTDDGSEGERGTVLDALRDFDESWVVHACGPTKMLRALKDLAKDRKVYLSLEADMACGWGVCLGCVVKATNGKFLRVCYEGPVFPAQEVLL